MNKFVSVALHKDGEVTTSAPDAKLDEEGAVMVTALAFEMIPSIDLIRLYRVSPQAADLILVETWKR